MFAVHYFPYALMERTKAALSHATFSVINIQHMGGVR